MTGKASFLARHPGVFFLDGGDPEGIAAYMKERAWLAAGESVLGAEKAGEGNMNCALRVRTSARTLILKQSRPWVEKYPHIAAPWDRALVEGRFYEAVARIPEIAGRMPGLLGFDPEARVLALEDLGHAQDFTHLYCGSTIEEPDLDALASYLSHLHRSIPRREFGGSFANSEMRALNHMHIFCLPLKENNGIDLDAITPGLQEAARMLKNRTDYGLTVAGLGALYLEEGPSLLHGDFFPGSWLRTARGIRVIDPEFCFFGPPEFDLGVMTAHLYLSGQRIGAVKKLFAAYRPAARFDEKLALRFAGVEIMRRLIGVAQLQLAYGLAKRIDLLSLSLELVLHP